MSVLEGSLVCPKCQGKTAVKDSRPNGAGSTIRRRRLCFQCGYRFTTFEMYVDEGLSPEGVATVVQTARRALEGTQLVLAEAARAMDAIDQAQQLLHGKLLK